MIFKVLARHATNREERVPKVALGPFRTDSAAFATAPATGLRVTWLGHSSTLLEIDGVRVLIDPIGDERASPVRGLGPKRFFAPPLPIEELPTIDIVVISHDHYDHLGKETIAQLAQAKATATAHWVTSLNVGAILRKFGLRTDRLTEMDWMDEVVIDGLRITALPARHFSGRSAWNRFETLWSSFVLRGPEHTVFYGADSGWWDGFAEIGAAYGPFDLAMLEIGAYDKLWEDIHLGPDGAVQAFSALGGGLLMPVHWGLFDLGLHAWRQPIDRLVKLAQEQGIALWAPEPGMPTPVVRGESLISDWWLANSR